LRQLQQKRETQEAKVRRGYCSVLCGAGFDLRGALHAAMLLSYYYTSIGAHNPPHPRSHNPPKTPPTTTQALAEAEAQQASLQQRTAKDAARRLRIRSEMEAALPPEPAPSDPHGTCVFRLPDGGRLLRRFRPSDPVRALFDYVDSQGGGGLWPGEYRLVSAYPRRVIEPPLAAAGGTCEGVGGEGGGGESLEAAAGLAAGQQLALLLEQITSGS